MSLDQPRGDDRTFGLKPSINPEKVNVLQLNKDQNFSSEQDRIMNSE